MRPTGTTHSTMNNYRVTLYITYRHTYEADPYEEEGPLPCGRTGCQCSGDEEIALTAHEVDQFMQEVLYSEINRFYWYIMMVLPYDKTHTVSYEPGGKLTFTVTTDSELCELEEKLTNFREVFYDSGPGSEAVVPTIHEYPYTALCTLETGFTYNERGRIDIDLDKEITIVPINEGTP